jgi:3-deoxy-manno-octulosonate cytidylyltransferase (CMP-KDO synthetase)
VHVWQQAIKANIGPVVVACCGEEIASEIRSRGGVAVLTDPDLPKGSDRIYAALQGVENQEQYNVIINLQGDLPTIDPEVLKSVLAPLNNLNVDIATVAAVISDPSEIQNPNVVKIAICAPDPITKTGRALYFSRCPIPSNAPTYYHHIGIYAYRRSALEKFITLPLSSLENSENLEQLRAMEAGMRIEVTIVDTFPLGIDTQEDLEKARLIMAG